MTTTIESVETLEKVVQEYGFLPFFQNEIEGFSIEEHTPPSLWFSDTAPGPWEWKGPVIRKGDCVYGKFFRNKAGFISLEWLADFANYRRDGYDFDARYEDGLASHKDKTVYDTIEQHESLLTKELKALCNYRKGGNKGFETVITRLQMQTYVVVADFEYMVDKHGKQYGWGMARYSTPEYILGDDAVTAAYSHAPEESKQKIYDHLKKVLPVTAERNIWRIIG